MRPGQFLCGCDVPKMLSRISPDKATLETVLEDAEGFLICRVHHTRRYGWRGISNSKPGAAHLPRPGWTPLQQERYELYKEEPIERITPIHIAESLDRRDNRDPQHIGNAIRARSNGQGAKPLSEVIHLLSFPGAPLERGEV